MTRPYFTNGVLSAFGASGSLDNASNNPGVKSINDVSVEGIANRTDIATDNAMTDRTETSYNYPSATNIQMPVLRDQHMPYRNASTIWTSVSSGDPGIVEPVSAQLAVENRFASGSYQRPSFVPQRSNWIFANPFEAANSGHPQFSLNHISTSYSAHDRGAPSGLAEGMHPPIPTSGRGFATWTSAEVPNEPDGTFPPNAFYENTIHDAAGPLQSRGADLNQSTRDDPTAPYNASSWTMQPSLNGSSYIMVADYSELTDTARHSDMRHTLRHDLEPGMQSSAQMSSALPGETLVTRELASPVQGPERPPANGCNNHNLKNKSRQTSRKGKPRSQQEQDARDKGDCRQCKFAHKKCSETAPNGPYGSCARCTEKYRAIINHGERQFLPCQRMFNIFSDLLKRNDECGDKPRRLLECIQIDLIFDFLDTNLTGVPLREVEVLASLKTCITLATIHTFCSREEASKKQATLIRRYNHFYGMALYHWNKACKCLELAYNETDDASLWRWRIEQVAATFAYHLRPSHGIERLPQGDLDTTILRDDLLVDAKGMHRAFWQVVGLAWYGTKERGLFSRGEAEDDRIPIQPLPSNFETAIGSKLRVLPEELSVQEVDV